MTTFGTKLRLLREDSGYTQQEVADAIGVSRPSYSHYENDWNKPGLPIMDRLAKFYGVKLDELCCEDDEIVGEPVSLTVEDKYILQIFHRLSDENAEKVLEHARMLLYYQDRNH